MLICEHINTPILSVLIVQLSSNGLYWKLGLEAFFASGLCKTAICHQAGSWADRAKGLPSDHLAATNTLNMLTC
jgi:hypothetical protein